MAAGEQKGGGQFSWEYNSIIMVEKSGLPFRLSLSSVRTLSRSRRSFAFARGIGDCIRRFDACQFLEVKIQLPKYSVST